MSLGATNSFASMWSREMQRNNDFAQVIAPLVSRKFEGDLSRGGNTVYFDQWPTLLTRVSSNPHGVSSPVRYTRSTDIADSSHTVTRRSLVVQQEWAFREVVDDVDDYQSIHNLVEGLAGRAGVAFAQMWEIFLWSMAGSDTVAGSRASYSGSQGAGGDYGATNAAKSVITGNITYEWLLRIAAGLRTNNAAPGPHQIVVPPAFTAELLTEGALTNINDSKSAKEWIIGGRAGYVAGMHIYESNVFTQAKFWASSLQDDSNEALTAVSAGLGSSQAYHVFGGNLKEAIAFVKQINKPKITPAEKGFYMNVMQLSVYDGQLVNPDSFFDAIIY
jgi:hypothetical protein